ncbi:MAG: hypothetical protein FWG38_02150, partial [Defluviitaleaceae bacterium]|nr:hypothetical protein [Defluviitaleaceae bacterium]
MNRKTLTALLLTALMLSMLLSACGGNANTKYTPTPPTDISTNVPSDTPTEVPSEIPTEPLEILYESATIADYQALEAQFIAFETANTITLSGDIMFDLLAVEDATIFITTTMNRANGIDEMAETHVTRAVDGTILSEMEIIVTDGQVYADIVTSLFLVLSELAGDLAFFGMTPWDDAPYYGILTGPHTHMQYPQGSLHYIQANMGENRTTTGLNGAFSAETLENDMFRDDRGTFHIEVIGEQVSTYIDAALNEMNFEDVTMMLVPMAMVADIDPGLWMALETDFAGWLRSGDLSGAWLTVERTQTGDDTYLQYIELHIPGRAHLSGETAIAVGEYTPVLAPAHYLTPEELGINVGLWFMSMLDAPVPVASLPGDFDIRNPINYWVYLDGYRFAVGQTVADVAGTPFAPGREGLLDDTLAANTLTTISFEYRTAGGRLVTLGVGVVNPTSSEIPMMDARVRTLVIDRFTTQHLDSHGLMQGIQIGETTQEEIFAL